MASELARAISRQIRHDWARMGEIDSLALELGHSSDPSRRRAVLAALAELAQAGLIDFGEVRNRGFEPWHASAEESLARVQDAWRVGNEKEWRWLWIRNTDPPSSS
jgi:aryl-alcohol dehydrogenase-like predicted oxidoreductase